MATLAELARAPDITGSIGRGAAVGGQLAQLAGLQRQRRAAEAVDAALAGGVPMGRDARTAATSEAFRTGGAEAGLALRSIFGEMDEARRQSEIREGQIIARELIGANDQDTYTQALARLNANPDVDVSTLPEIYDPSGVASIIRSVRDVEDMIGDVRSPEAQAQAIERAQAGRSTGGTTVINVGSSPLGKMIADRNALVAAGVAADDPALQALNRQIDLQAKEGLTEEAEAAEAEAGREERRRMTTDIVTQDIRRARDLVQGQSIVSPVTGIGGAAAQFIPGSRRSNAEALIATVGANIGLDRLQRMREESRTGGALGNVTEGEREALQATLGSLSLSQDDPQLVENMDRLEVLYLETIHGGDAMEILQMPLSELSQFANRVNELTEAEQRALELRLDRLGVE